MGKRGRMIALTLAVVWPPVAAEEPPPTPRFEERIAVEVVTVDVVVTDRKGRPVSGLTKEDFAVFEDGLPMTLTHFHGPDKVPGESADPSAQAPSVETTEPSPPEDARPLHFVLYFDDYTLEPSHRARILSDLRTFVTRGLPEDTRVMVVQHRPGVQIAAPFTTAGAQIASAVQRVERSKPTVQAIDRFREGRRVLEDIATIYRIYEDVNPFICPEGDPCVCGWAEMRAVAEQHASNTLGQIDLDLDGLAAVIAALSGVSGRKAVLYVGDGLPRQPGFEVFHFLTELCPQKALEGSAEAMGYDASSAIEHLTAHANANRVTLYTLEGAGLRTYSASSVEFDDRRFTPSALNDKLRISNLQSTLFQLADQTGGKAILNANRAAPALERVGTELVQSYSLGYQSDHPPEGKSHRLRVELTSKKQRKLELRYRLSYRHKTEEERLAERLLAALELEMTDNPLGIEVEIGTGEPIDTGRFRVPVRITVPTEALMTAGAQEADEECCRVFLTARDAQGRRTEIREKLVPVEDPGAAEDPHPSHVFVVRMELPAGEHRIAVGVRDEETAVASYVLAEVDVGTSPPVVHD